MDSADELCEELLHIPGTQIQCATSDVARKHDLDVMAGGEEHGQTLLYFLPSKHAASKIVFIFKNIFSHMGVCEGDSEFVQLISQE